MAITTVTRDIVSIVNSVTSIFGSQYKFPNNLNTSRYLEIAVYDTSNVDKVNKGLSAGAKNVEELATKAFTIVETTINDLKSTIKETGVANKSLPREFKANIFLPFPNTISETFSHEYADEPGWADQAAKAFVKDTAESGVTKFNGLAAGLAKATGSQAYKYFENQIQMYQKTAFRSIDLIWHLVPNNKEENAKIHEIIRVFKMYSSAEALAGKLILRSPHFFELRFSNKTLQNALQFTEVNLISIVVEYSPGGNMEMFNDELPKSVSVNMTFQDREPKLHKHWKDGYTPWTENNQTSDSCGTTAKSTETSQVSSVSADTSTSTTSSTVASSSTTTSTPASPAPPPASPASTTSS